MNVSLTPELAKLVHDKVESGLYGSASEVVREALRLMNDHDVVRQHRLDELRREIAIGIDQADCGQIEPLDIDAIMAEGRRLLADRRRAK
jgi:antitoxin ParD1/3/4